MFHEHKLLNCQNYENNKDIRESFRILTDIKRNNFIEKDIFYG